MARVVVTLEADEKNALYVLAERRFRDPRAQAALIIRSELERQGLLPSHRIAVCQQEQEAHHHE
jgi:hypothetical protein